jgi:hypothetical protein
MFMDFTLCSDIIMDLTPCSVVFMDLTTCSVIYGLDTLQCYVRGPHSLQCCAYGHDTLQCCVVTSSMIMGVSSSNKTLSFKNSPLVARSTPRYAVYGKSHRVTFVTCSSNQLGEQPVNVAQDFLYMGNK